MFKEFIQLGDKIDIRFVQQVERKEELPHIYKSQITDITDDGEMELMMPIENGRLVLLPLGVRFEFIFYTAKGMYHSIGQIKERYKKDNLHLILVELHSQLKKYQRREYYRYPCQMEAQCYFITKEDADTKTTEQIVEDLRDEHFYEKSKQVSIHDLSGGGVRVVSTEKFVANSYILLVFRLINQNRDKQYFLTGCVLDSEKIENSEGKFESRVQFIFRDNQVREEIIRYIFEEERKNRQLN